MFGVNSNAAGAAWYDSCARLWAAWGVDYIKVDDLSKPYHTAEVEMVRNAIDKCGRAIVFSTSPGETPIADAQHILTHANLWRVSDDFWDNWKSLDHEFTLAARWHNFAAPGHWPDADMLPLGHLSVSHRSVGKNRCTHFTRDEQLTLLSFWCLLPSPLMVGGNLPDNDAWTLALLTNPEVLAVNQDAAGRAAQPMPNVPTAAAMPMVPISAEVRANNAGGQIPRRRVFQPRQAAAVVASAVGQPRVHQCAASPRPVAAPGLAEVRNPHRRNPAARLRAAEGQLIRLENSQSSQRRPRVFAGVSCKIARQPRAAPAAMFSARSSR